MKHFSPRLAFAATLLTATVVRAGNGTNALQQAMFIATTPGYTLVSSPLSKTPAPVSLALIGFGIGFAGGLKIRKAAK